MCLKAIRNDKKINLLSDIGSNNKSHYKCLISCSIRFPKSCVIELDGVDSELSDEFYALLWQRLNQASIPFTLHWGKINHYLNEATLLPMYGAANIVAWKRVRGWLLDSVELRSVFTNGFMERLGLDEVGVGVELGVGELVV